MAKYCRVCRTKLTNENWTPSNKKYNVYLCRKCVHKNNKGYYGKHQERMNRQNKQYREDHKEQIRQQEKHHYKNHRKEKRQYDLMHIYHITPEQYKIMLEQQDYRCAICSKKFTKENPVCVDHNHKTGEVRALLCSKCNTAIGLLQDNPSTIRKAEMYIRKYSN